VQALGIANAETGIEYEPGLNETYEFYVRGGPQMSKVNIWTRGALSKYIKPSIETVTLGPGEVRHFDVTVDIPEKPEIYGLITNEVVATEMPPEAEVGVGAFVEVSAYIRIYIPYPWKYLELSFPVPNVAISQPVPFKITIYSRGELNVTARGIVNVTDSEGKNMAILHTDDKFVEAKKTETMEAVWNTTGIDAGRYYAGAAVEYGGEKPATANTEFKIGDLIIKIQNISHKDDIKPDEIVRFEIDLESYWNEEIKNVYVNLFAYDENGGAVGTSKSETIDIATWVSRKVLTYWDTTNLKEGEYDIKFVVNYAGKTAEKNIRVEIKLPPPPPLPPPPEFPYATLLILLAVAAIILAVAVYIKRGKRNKNKR
jgi:hypothetical protein